MNIEVQHLSHSFRTDAADLIAKVRCASNPRAKNTLYPKTSYIAKLVVDAYMACECALKALIASSNKDKNGSEVYKMIRDCGHDLVCLIEQAHPKSLTQSDRNFLTHANEGGVNLRYSLDLFSLATCDLFPNDEASFRLDQSYLADFLRIADVLSKEADERHRVELGTKVFLSSRQEFENYVTRLRAITPKKK